MARASALSQEKPLELGDETLARLDALASDLDGAALAEVPPHATYRAGIEKTHARKAAFWANVKA